jgi:hypothetical protein
MFREQVLQEQTQQSPAEDARGADQADSQRAHYAALLVGFFAGLTS